MKKTEDLDAFHSQDAPDHGRSQEQLIDMDKWQSGYNNINKETDNEQD